MNIAYTVWTWFLDPFDNFSKPETVEKQKVQFEKAAREISYLGYDSVENFNIIVDTFGDDTDTLKSILQKYNLTLRAVYHYLKTDYAADLEMGKRCIEFLKKMNCDILNLQAPKHAPEGTTKEAILDTAAKSNEMGKIAADNGIKLCMHPHWGSTVEKEHEIELFAESTDPRYVHFCIDTAHTQLLNMDPIKIVEQYRDRLAYIHLKDVDPDVTITPERPMNRFRALGQGTVDFKGVYKKLVEIGFDGTLCVELDYPVICNYQSAQVSRHYIRDVLGI
ncbi:sugar phosphate isomerase/epimerase family protein [Breznakiella homolactica]|uniref:TIM barrel protein n=1 Tax=Breznakiella homolactica TaxID=2798577 RepID=A0A7T7XN62_9SPIR|nr:sugar phosphate isomerase/epimerase [Breznakiella homolactica]QQO09368.1 sugar phosphate isomerase/epimerase [Breznakiella homolactica]